MDFIFNRFDVEEQMLLNNLALDESKEVVLNKLSASIIMAVPETKDYLKSLLLKVQSLSEKDWGDLQNYLPFNITIQDGFDESILSELDEFET